MGSASSAAGEEFAEAVNQKGSAMQVLLPGTLAKSMSGELPPPEITAISIGFNPGGLRSGKLGVPNGHDINDNLEQAQAALEKGMDTRKRLQELDARFKKAAEAHAEAMTKDPYEIPDIIPPMVVSDSPDGMHSESPYGPWEPGEPPFAGEHERDDLEVAAAHYPTLEDIARAGNLDKAAIAHSEILAPYVPT